MFIQKMSVEVKLSATPNAVFEELVLLEEYFRKNGQTYGTEFLHCREGSRIVCFLRTPERSSLAKKHHNRYVAGGVKKIEELCGSKISFELIGEAIVPGKRICSCKKPAFYILKTNYVTVHSPVSCGSCDLPVPLYRLPKYYDDSEYWPILSWETDYRSCDKLQMNCSVGEKWALRQMQEINSQLSKEGREICRELEKLTGVPTYYFLYDYKNYRGNDSAKWKCPGCGGKWALSERLHYEYEFLCQKCRLISLYSRNSNNLLIAESSKKSLPKKEGEILGNSSMMSWLVASRCEEDLK